MRDLRAGDRVVAPFTINCGACFYCRRGLTGRCLRSSGFGFVTEEGLGLEGAQAERVRVPLADSTLVKLPEQRPRRAALRGSGGALSGRHPLDGLRLRSGRRHRRRRRGGGGGLRPGRPAVRAGGPAVRPGRGGRRRRRSNTGASGPGPSAPCPAAGPEEAARLVRELTDGRGADAVLEAVGVAGRARPGDRPGPAGRHREHRRLPHRRRLPPAHPGRLRQEPRLPHRPLPRPPPHRSSCCRWCSTAGSGTPRSSPTSCPWPRGRGPTRSSPSAAKTPSRSCSGRPEGPTGRPAGRSLEPLAAEDVERVECPPEAVGFDCAARRGRRWIRRAARRPDRPSDARTLTTDRAAG